MSRVPLRACRLGRARCRQFKTTRSLRRDLDSLPRPFPGWQTEWIHLGHAPASHRRRARLVRIGNVYGPPHLVCRHPARHQQRRQRRASRAACPLRHLPRISRATHRRRRCLVLAPGAASRSLSTGRQRRHDLRRARVIAGDGERRRRSVRRRSGAYWTRRKPPCWRVAWSRWKRSVREPHPHRGRRSSAHRAPAAVGRGRTMFTEAGPRSPIDNARALQRHLAVIRACELHRCASARVRLR